MPFVSVPNSGQSLGATRDQIRNNIDSLKASIAVNHIDLDTGNTGKHKFLQMPSQASAPGTAVDELALYVRTTTAIRLFLRPENNGTEIQMSGINPKAANNGYTFLPGGMLMQWGRRTMPSASSIHNLTFTLEGGVAFDAAPFIAQVSASTTSNTQKNIAMFAGLTATTIQLVLNGTEVADIHWLVIGPKA